MAITSSSTVPNGFHSITAPNTTLTSASSSKLHQRS